MTLFRSAATIGFFTLCSRILGFLRDICIAVFIGANMWTDAFFVAFKLPNFMRRLFAEGAFNSAFVPLYAGTLAENGRKEAQQFASQALSVLVCILILLTIVVEIFMPQIMVLLAPGFVGEPEKFALTVALTRITFPYILFISVVSLLGGILNSVEKFAAVAATPILLNIALVVAILAFRNSFETPAHALAWGVFAAGIMQCVWLVLFCQRCGMLPALSRPRITPQVKRLLVLIGPAALGAGVAQVNLLVDMIIASTVPEGVSYLYYADRINQLPLGVIGVGVGTALLPMLSKQMRNGHKADALSTQNRAIEIVLLFGLPCALALMVIAEPIIATLFEHGAFTAKETAATYPALIAYAAGLPSFVLIKVLAPGFFANQDTKTPFYIALVCLCLNIGLNLLLVGPMAHTGLALATTITGWINAGAMAAVLHRRGLLQPDASLSMRSRGIVLASIAMVATLEGTYLLLQDPFAGSWQRFPALAALIISGAGVYLLLINKLEVFTLAQLKAVMRRKAAS